MLLNSEKCEKCLQYCTFKSTKNCDFCRKRYNNKKAKKYRNKNRNLMLLRTRLWRKLNSEHVKTYNEIWNEQNPDYHNEYRNCNKKDIIQRQENWRKNNPDKNTAKSNKYRCNKLNATPKWLTEQHFKEMQEWYTLAKELQWLSVEKLQVDHIVPLKGKYVCGLHVPWNLQILPKSVNISKGNRLK